MKKADYVREFLLEEKGRLNKKYDYWMQYGLLIASAAGAFPDMKIGIVENIVSEILKIE